MGLPLDRFRGSYFLRAVDPDFATERRSRWVYATPSLRVSFASLNSEGPEPLEYLEYARRDLVGRTQQGAINALGNAKRAIDLVIDRLLGVYSLEDWLGAPFPVRAELLGDVGALPTRMVKSLNHARNVMEHEYVFVEVDRAQDFVEIAELFLTAAYPFFINGVIGVYVGSEDGECWEYRLNREARRIEARVRTDAKCVDFDFGRIHYNMQFSHAPPVHKIPVTKEHQTEWMSCVDLFTYCTRRELLRLPKHDVHENGATYHAVTSKFYLEEDET